MEPLGKGCDGSVRTPELLQNAASGGVRERTERGIEVGLAILNHMVQYSTWVTALQWEVVGQFESRDWETDLRLVVTPTMRREDSVQPHLRATSVEAILKNVEGRLAAWQNLSTD